MKVKVFDEAHEKDLESSINDFLEENEKIEVVDIKFGVACSLFGEEQIYCFSALITYRKGEDDDAK
ncbi:MAG: sporulation protein Cse60 [Bacilli bacterium]